MKGIVSITMDMTINIIISSNLHANLYHFTNSHTFLQVSLNNMYLIVLMIRLVQSSELWHGILVYYIALVSQVYTVGVNKEFLYRNHKMVKLRLRSDMITILLIYDEGRITVLK